MFLYGSRFDEYRKNIEKDGALERGFQKAIVERKACIGIAPDIEEYQREYEAIAIM